jgi:hypothetical protein
MYPSINPHTLAESLKRSGLEDVENVAQSSPQASSILNGNTPVSRGIWRTAADNDLKRENLTQDDLIRIAKNPYIDESILMRVLINPFVDDSVLDEVARNKQATPEILLAIVRHDQLGVVESEEPDEGYDWQPGSARWRYETRIRTEIAQLPTSAALCSVAQNENATTDILMHIVQHSHTGAKDGFGTLMYAAEHREADEPVLRQILDNPFIEGSTLLAIAKNRHVTQDMLREIRDHPRATYIVEEVDILLSGMQLSSGPHYAQPTRASNARLRAIAGRGMRERDPSYTPLSSSRGTQGGQSVNLPRNSTSMGGYPAHGGLSRGQFIGPSSASTSHSIAHQPSASSTLRGRYASTPAGHLLRNLDLAGADSRPNPNYRGRAGHHR